MRLLGLAAAVPFLVLALQALAIPKGQVSPPMQRPQEVAPASPENPPETAEDRTRRFEAEFEKRAISADSKKTEGQVRANLREKLPSDLQALSVACRSGVCRVEAGPKERKTLPPDIVSRLPQYVGVPSDGYVRIVKHEGKPSTVLAFLALHTP